MKNLSIRTRILGGVVLINLIGALVVIVYLHQSYSSGLDVTAAETLRQAKAGWEQVAGEEALDPLTQQAEISAVLESMSEITGAEYGYLLDKAVVDEASYESARAAAGLPNNWSERDGYALVAVTDEAVADKMVFTVDAASVPEGGKVVGIENGACSKTCHESMTGEGEYWGVKWSEDHRSRAHAVVPVTDAGGSPIGVIYAEEDISAQADAARVSMNRTLIVIGLTLVIATVVIGMIVDLLVFRRLASTVSSIQDLSVRVAGGDFDAHFEPDGTNDEIGQFEQFFSQLMDLISGTLKSLTRSKSDQDAG